MNPASLSLIVSLAWLFVLVVRTNERMKEDNGELDLRNPIVLGYNAAMLGLIVINIVILHNVISL
jgi:hypothetical protein